MDGRSTREGQTALYTAAYSGHHTILVDLIRAGASLDLQDNINV